MEKLRVLQNTKSYTVFLIMFDFNKSVERRPNNKIKVKVNRKNGTSEHKISSTMFVNDENIMFEEGEPSWNEKRTYKISKGDYIITGNDYKYSYNKIYSLGLKLDNGDTLYSKNGDIRVAFNTMTRGQLSKSLGASKKNTKRLFIIPKSSDGSKKFKIKAESGQVKILFKNKMGIGKHIGKVKFSTSKGLIFIKLTPYASKNPYVAIWGNFSNVKVRLVSWLVVAGL